MYLMLTDRCNMSCGHCFFDCKETGEDMGQDTFRQAVDLSRDENILLGGGEPTVHPEFWDFLQYALDRGKNVDIITNGKRTKDALKLAKLSRDGIIHAQLSRDIFHEPVDKKVVEAFKKIGRLYNFQEASSLIPLKSGRARNLEAALEGCPCLGPFVKVNGDIYQCGCESSPVLGKVADGVLPKPLIGRWTCFSYFSHKIFNVLGRIAKRDLFPYEKKIIRDDHIFCHEDFPRICHYVFRSLANSPYYRDRADVHEYVEDLEKRFFKILERALSA